MWRASMFLLIGNFSSSSLVPYKSFSATSDVTCNFIQPISDPTLATGTLSAIFALISYCPISMHDQDVTTAFSSLQLEGWQQILPARYLLIRFKVKVKVEHNKGTLVKIQAPGVMWASQASCKSSSSFTTEMKGSLQELVRLVLWQDQYM